MVSLAKRLLIGKPIATSEEGHQRLRKRVALPIFASDAMSSTAYATNDEILIVLLIQAGVGGLAFDRLVPLAIVVAVLLFIVVLSYRQTVYAYPSGGGAYIVSKENLGELPSLVAGASLLTDYILTVAVSVAAGVLAMQSAFDFDSSLRVPLCLGIIVLITIANLRGMRESGALFAPPTYLYILMLGVLIVVGLYRVFFRDLGPIPLEELSEEAQELAAGTATLSLFMLLRVFSSGAVALSGVEAVSNGVQTFRKPESRNAANNIGLDGTRARGWVPGDLRARIAPSALPRRARPDRDRPDGRVRLRWQERVVLDHPVGHVRHPRARRQHRLRRVPRPFVDHRPRPIPAGADGEPR